MVDYRAIIDSIVEVAKAAAPMIGPGGKEAVVLGERVIEMIDHAIEAFSGKPLPNELPAQREAIEAKIRAHVADTAKRLRG